MKTSTIARAGLLLGLGASLAANVAHAVTVTGQDVAPLAGATFWPLALLVTSELLFRLRFDARADVLAAGAVACVAAGAGWISLGHTRALLLSWGESDAGAVLGALAVDGVLVACGCALYRDAHRRASAPATSAPATSAVGRTLSAPAPQVRRTRALVTAESTSAPRALVRASAPVPECAPSAPRVHSGAPAPSALGAQVHPSAPESTSAARALVSDADALERLRVHLLAHPEQSSARAVSRALGVGQARAARLLRHASAGESMSAPGVHS